MGQAEEVWTENKKSGEVLHPLKAKAARCWLHRFKDFAHAIDSPWAVILRQQLSNR